LVTTVRRCALLALLLALLLAGVSCSASTNGSPVPSGAGDGPSGRPTLPTPLPGGDPTGTSDRPGSGRGPLAGTDPCTLLSSAGQAQLGVSGGKPNTVGSSRGCTWNLRGPQDTYIFTVAIRDTGGLKDLPNDSRHTKLPDVGSHEAVRSAGSAGPGSCGVILGVTESSRVETSVIAGTDEDKACGLAGQLAGLVEPKLPQG
jgi:Protein of unknown function (DUF3558)